MDYDLFQLIDESRAYSHIEIPKSSHWFLNDVPIKGCNKETKDLTLKKDGYCIFVKKMYWICGLYFKEI